MTGLASPPPEGLAAATALLDQGRLEDALRAFKDLGAAEKGSCGPCWLGMAEAQLQLGNFEDAEKSCRKAVKLLEEGVERARGLNLLGTAMASQGNDPRHLKEAEAAFREALKTAPSVSQTRFNLGAVLLRQSRDDEGVAELRLYLEAVPTGPTAARARELVEKPRRARLRYAPAFKAKTLDGESISLKTLEGRIVLLDFWATWCAPCRAALPEIKDLRRKYPEDRLTIVSISVDDDPQLVRRFVAEHAMSWTQCHDGAGSLRTAFGVEAFPTYVVLDGDGAILSELRGTNPRQSIGYRLRQALGPVLDPPRP